ncbi:MAG: pyrophosphohydrolase including oxidative damage repair enzyme [Candidatus Saccharibacteria bacterium]|nr:pyrophosphohydrolase including oxidative damage repair enzyme [Candidatus Saccharibacteria bacterium]
MAHIHTKPGQHDHTISIYLFRTDFSEPKVMLHFHKKMNSLAQFGGHIELDENPWEALIHELKEETGYNIEQVSLLQPHTRLKSITGSVVHPYPVTHTTMGYPNKGGHAHTDSAYALTANEEPHESPDEGESTDLRLFTKAELIAAKDTINPITYDIASFIFDEILDSWDTVSTNDFI